jgi:hypothetical protein
MQDTASAKLYELEKDNFINTERSGQLADMHIKYETQKKLDFPGIWNYWTHNYLIFRQ